MTEDYKKEDNEISLKEKALRIFFFFIGTFSLIFGIIGIFIPILPTTPLLLLAAACYARSSKRAYNWLLNNRIFGQYIKNYKEGKGMPLKIKVFTITLLWVVILISTFLIIKILWIQIIMLIIATIITIHIVLIKPKQKN
jgi:hypothetical protein